MCLITNEFPIITEEDITCYKLVRKVGEGLYASETQNHLYEDNKIYGIKQRLSTQCVIDYRSSFDKSPNLIISGSVYHSYNSYEIIKKNENLPAYVIIKCIIPKGSILFKGRHDTYASNCIKVIGECV